MIAKFEKSSIFKKIIDALKDICKETNANINVDGMTIKAMDSSHVSLFHLQLKEAFSEFCIEEDVAIAFNLDHLSRIMKVCDNDAQLELSLQRDGTKLHIESKTNDRLTKFDMHLLDLEMESMEVPEMNYPISITMQSSEYTRLCRDMSQFSDTLKLRVKNDCIEFSVDGECGSGDLILQPSDKTTIVFGACVEINVSIKYLMLFAKATPICENVTLEIAENLPLRVSFKITELDYLTFYLAPKIDEG